MQKFLENLELIHTGIGVLVIATTFAIFRSVTPWRAAALCALAVGVLHGLIFYAVRSTQRKARNNAVRAIRYQMQEVLLSKLQAPLHDPGLKDDAEWRSVIIKAIQDIERSLATIEVESLSDAGF